MEEKWRAQRICPAGCHLESRGEEKANLTAEGERVKYRSSATAALTVRSVSISPMAADPRNYLNAVFSGPCDRCTALYYTRMRSPLN